MNVITKTARRRAGGGVGDVCPAQNNPDVSPNQLNLFNFST